MDVFAETPERARVTELLNRMRDDSETVEALLREMGAAEHRLESQADITQYLVQQRSLVSQDWRLADEAAAAGRAAA